MNLRGWRGIQDIRDALHAEGFRVDRVYAELNAAISNNQFSVDEYLNERDNHAYWKLSGIRLNGRMEREPEPPSPIAEHLEPIFMNLSQADWNSLIDVPILERKIDEWHLIPSDCTEYVMRNDEIRNFALKIAERQGFKKTKARFRTISPVIAKEDADTGLIVFFGLEGRPMDGGMGLVRRFDFNLRSYITDGALDDSIEIKFSHFDGMSYYQTLSGLPNSHYNYRTDNPEQMEFWSEVIQIGIVASVRFLNLFHSSVVKFRKEQDASK